MLACVRLQASHLNTFLFPPSGVPIPQPLPDRRQGGVLPEQLPHEVLQTEGATYSWLHSYVQSIYLHTTCAEQGNNTPWKVPAGWNMQK